LVNRRLALVSGTHEAHEEPFVRHLEKLADPPF
jgi:hypothetical protein